MDKAKVQTLISRHFPDFKISKVEKIGEGIGNVAFEINTDFIFRFPKGSENQKRLECEISIQSILKKYSSLPVPEFMFLPKDHSFVGYKKLPGNQLLYEYKEFKEWQTFSKQIGTFLTSLHSIPSNEFKKIDLSKESRSFDDWICLGQDYFEKTKLVIPARYHQNIELFFRSNTTFNIGSPVLCHNDLGIEHILIKDKAVSGIIDWGGLTLADPACDFARLYRDVGGRILNKVLTEYITLLDKNKLRQRAIFIGKCIYFEDLFYGKNKKKYLEKSLVALRWLF